jgi:hypothetical protein
MGVSLLLPLRPPKAFAAACLGAWILLLGLRPAHPFNVGPRLLQAHRGRNPSRLGATTIREQAMPSSSPSPTPPGFLKIGGFGEPSSPKYRDEPEADFETWFWGASPDGGIESALFADDDRAVVLFDGGKCAPWLPAIEFAVC